MEHEIIVRDAERADCEALYPLVGEMVHLWKGPDRPVYGNAQAFERLLFDLKMANAAVAFCDGELAGYVFWTYAASSLNCMPSILMENFFVLPEFRRRGIGTAMYRFFQQKSIDEGVLGLEWFGNYDATEICFFASLGKKPDGNPRVAYHWNNGNHAPGCAARDTEKEGT